MYDLRVGKAFQKVQNQEERKKILSNERTFNKETFYLMILKTECVCEVKKKKKKKNKPKG